MSRMVDCFIDRDHSGHWYLVEEARREEWNRWLDLPEEDEDSWNAPAYADRLAGHPSSFVFKYDKTRPNVTFR